MSKSGIKSLLVVIALGAFLFIAYATLFTLFPHAYFIFTFVEIARLKLREDKS